MQKIFLSTGESGRSRMDRQYSAKTLIALVLLTAVLTLSFAFFGLWQIYGLGSDLGGEAARFREAREVISRHYVGQILDESHLTDAAIAAAVAALGDPWSRFLTEYEFAAHRRRTENRQQGIGVSYARDEETNEMQIRSVIPGSPAYEAGITVGDTLVSLEDMPVSEMLTERFREIVAANYGSVIRLEVRDSAGEQREVLIDVQSYYVNPVSFEMMAGDVGYIRIANFQLTSGEETIAAIEALLYQGAEGLIFDLRYNPGGRLHELLLVLDYILPEGELFVTADYTGRETVRYSNAYYLRMPMVVLVNAHSASAAEFFAAILQERDWAAIVGTPTMGKGRVQETISLRGGGVIVLSTSRYLTPGRVDLYEAGGIVPDYYVPLREDGEDRQLEKALALLG
jgi:carboxyl-terminal processing protease